MLLVMLMAILKDLIEMMASDGGCRVFGDAHGNIEGFE